MDCIVYWFSRPAGLNRKKYQVLDSVLKPFREIDINFNEFAAFKAVTFLNPDADVSLQAKLSINDERIAVTKQLYAYMIRKDGIDTAIKRLAFPWFSETLKRFRFSRLILIGTTMSKMACESKEAVWIADFFENIGYTDFAKELFFGDVQW